MSTTWTFIRNGQQEPQVSSAPASSSQSPKLDSTGSGFIINQRGQVLTNHHVVSGCSAVNVQVGQEKLQAAVQASDATNDLALLNTNRPASDFAAFADGSQPKLGESILTFGYPLQGILAPSVNLSTGITSSLAGMQGDSRMMQITAPVQSGSSGGPVVDLSGRVVGVVTSKLNSQRLEAASGNLSENVGFAIKAGIVKSFLDSQQVEYNAKPFLNTLETTVLAEAGQRFTVAIECWR